MNATIYISGKIGKDTTLIDVVRQFKSFDSPSSVEAVIHSEGGNVEEGEAIYNYLKTLDVDIPVTTITDKAYSIAAKIFAAGRERIVEDVDKALMIHFAWARAEGNADKFEAIAEALREYENEFAEFYSSFLLIDEDTVRMFLDSETFISGEEAVDLGFATKTKVTAEAVAEFNIEISKSNKMIEKEKKEKSKGRKLLEAMAEFVGVDLKEIEVNAELTLQDSTGTEIIFPDVDTGNMPVVGDAATIDGMPIPDGSYIMPGMEDSTIVCIDGKVSEIQPKEEEVVAENKSEINAEEIQEVSVWSVNVSNTSFELGETVFYEYENESYPVGAGEFQLADGRRIVTDASGVIVNVKGVDEVTTEITQTETAPTETEASFEELKEKMSLKLKAEIEASLKADYEKKLSDKEAEIVALKKNQGSKEFNAEQKEIESPKNRNLSPQANILLTRFKNNN